jgi:transcriptional regulator with XRE-family HTH domain
MTSDFAKTRLRLGSRIARLRKKAGFTQAVLAEESEISDTYVCQIENGRCNPSLKKLWGIARALGIEYEDLCKD